MFDKSALSEIQGNIMEGYRLPCVAHLFGSITAANADSWRCLLPELTDQITSAEEWQEPPTWTLNVGLSHAALSSLEPQLARQIEPAFPAFAAGMGERAALLGDTDAFDRPRWSAHHVWLCVYADNPLGLTARVDALQATAQKFGLEFHQENPRGAALPDPSDGRVWREHFGFRDNISNPAVAGWPRQSRRTPDESYAGRGKYSDGRWLGIAAGEFLLGHVTEAGEDLMEGLSEPARAWLHNATFGVFRKLHQDVAAFRAYLAAHATPEVSAAYLASRMVGRDYDGVPVGAPDAAYMQKFTYEHDKYGSGCPLGAHVRRANPRTSGRHRLFRRGMTYGPPLPEGQQDDGRERGLWFVAFNASIEDQFELIQRHWLNGPSGSFSDATDPISSGQETRNMVIEGDQDTQRMPRLLTGIPRFVTCRGGEYYLLPTKRALRQLAHPQGYRESVASLEVAS